MRINIELDRDELQEIAENSSVPDYRQFAVDSMGNVIEIKVYVRDGVKA